jgi:hypothetical protein
MAYDQAFFYFVLGGVVVILIGVALFLWRASRRPESGRPDEDAR